MKNIRCVREFFKFYMVVVFCLFKNSGWRGLRGVGY